MADVLVSYYSRSGATELLARRLAEQLNADLEPIRPKVAYDGGGGALKAVWHALLKRTSALEPGRDPAAYRLLVVAGPVWAGRLSAPMRAYLRGPGQRAKALAAVWVSGSGQPYGGVGGEIQSLCGRPLVASASFAEAEVRKGEADARLASVVEAVGGQVPA